jgi:hypothetical protein
MTTKSDEPVSDAFIDNPHAPEYAAWLMQASPINADQCAVAVRFNFMKAVGQGKQSCR